MREEIRDAERLANYSDFIFGDKIKINFDRKYTILAEPPVIWLLNLLIVLNMIKFEVSNVFITGKYSKGVMRKKNE